MRASQKKDIAFSFLQDFDWAISPQSSQKLVYFMVGTGKELKI